MTRRDNYLLAMNRKHPQWLPIFEDDCKIIMPEIFIKHMMTDEKIDLFGVKWILDDIGAMPDTQYIALKDIAKWRDTLHLPDINSIDWDEMAKRDLASSDPDKATCVMFGNSGNYFITLVNMMGFTEGLCAIYEDPEEVGWMFQYLENWFIQALDKILDAYKPDTVVIGDDVAAANNMFFSVDTFEKLLHPHFQPMIDLIHKKNAFVEFHCCGHCEPVIDILVDMGIDSWQPAQPVNDLKRLKEKVVINGGWDAAGPGGVPGASEDAVRKAARETIEKWAPGGNYICWFQGPMGTSPDVLTKNKWLFDESRIVGKDIYKF